ncbi:hypothetical protein TVAGG3_0474770, partial [Trichomonas vaginalis G3]|uniref:hypothetical protein n=1 Tax=Trichomonas vaginalis (strain ATCC PRA-98 / G3) TaxID=412133 RepID=UPI0021E53263
MFFLPTENVFPSNRKSFSFQQEKFFLLTGHKRMSHVPPTQSIPKPEEPKEPQQSPQQPQFQQVPPPNYYQFPLQGYYPPQGFPNYPPLPMPYFPNPWMFQQAPPQQFQSQSKSKRDQEFEE